MSVAFLRVGSYHNGKYFGAVKDIKAVQSHLKYIGFRSRERSPDDKLFFGRNEDQSDWRAFFERVRDHKALQHSQTPKVHKMIFSLRKDDYEAYLKSGRSYRDIVRASLEDYERRKGVTLDWIAVVHDQNHHPHCHVVVRAVSETQADGKSRRIFFSRDDIREIKSAFNVEVERHMVEKEKKLEKQRWNQDRDLMTATILNEFSKNITRSIERAEYEREMKIMEQKKYDRGRDR